MKSKSKKYAICLILLLLFKQIISSGDFWMNIEEAFKMSMYVLPLICLEIPKQLLGKLLYGIGLMAVMVIGIHLIEPQLKKLLPYWLWVLTKGGLCFLIIIGIYYLYQDRAILHRELQD